MWFWGGCFKFTDNGGSGVRGGSRGAADDDDDDNNSGINFHLNLTPLNWSATGHLLWIGYNTV